MHSKSFAHGLLTLSLTAFSSLSFAQGVSLEETTLRKGNIRIAPSLSKEGYPTTLYFLPFEKAIAVTEPLTKEQFESARYTVELKRPLQLIWLKAEAKKFLDEDKKNDDFLSKGQKKGLEEIIKLAELLRAHIMEESKLSPQDALEVRASLQALSVAYNSQFLRPIKEKEDILSFFPRSAQQVATHSNDAVNVQKVGGQDFSQANPVNNSFWQKPANISTMDFTLAARSKNVFNGMDTSDRTLECEYDEPKTGYGIHPGFEIKCGELKLKLKFGNETHSEPFVTRMFNAMGFNTSRVEYVPEIRINYVKNGRKVMTEYNLRKAMTVKITGFFVIGITTLDIGGYVNPFDDIKGAEMMDGRILNVQQLRQGLFGAQADVPKVEMNDANYNVAFEKGIKALIMQKGNVEFKEDDIISIGAWDWNDSMISSRRDAKGAAFLAAFLNSYDMRWDNTRLKLYKNGKDNYELRHVISDLGSGLGRASNFTSTSNQTVNDFPFSFVAHPINTKGKFAIEGYNPIDFNDTFEQMSKDDARWMARLIAQITEEQFKQALVVSGFSSEEVMAYLPKLLTRRDRMVSYLDLENEISYLVPGDKEVRFTNYDPRKDGLVSVKNSLGQTLTAPDGGSIVVRGELRSRE